ncbi:MAG: hypothetical protein ACPGU7_04520 [Gammaproteobacteria bacterium]
MSDLTGLFDALYSKLLLRDFFGKVVPGAVVICALGFVVVGSAEVERFVQSAGFWPGLVILGFAWLIGFAVQAFGEVTKLIGYHDYETGALFYKRRKLFIEHTDAREHQQLERLVVIKEACGNGYVALLLGGVLVSLDFVVTSGLSSTVLLASAHWHAIVFFVVLIAALAKMHRIQIKRQTEYMDAIHNLEDDQNSE